jgi:hypothetical protein
MIEGPRDQPWLATAADAKLVIEACFSARSRDALLYAANLPPAFFDFSSRLAGEYLQKWRNYQIRVAVVCPANVVFSTRFGEMLAEEAGRGFFRVVGTRDEAVAWLEQVGDEAAGG